MIDMNIDLFGTATQILPSYSHQHKTSWDVSGVPYSCSIAYRLEAGSSPLVSLTGSTLTLTTNDPSKVGSHTATITAYFDGVAGGEHSQTITLLVSGGAECQTSGILQTTPLTAMSTVLGSTSTQAIDPYSHQFEASWPAGSCVVAYRIKGGDTSYASLSG